MSHGWKKRVIGLGGTFDHFHTGHQAFLDFAAQQGGLLKIGLTADAMVKSKPWSATIQPYPARKQAVTKYCSEQGYPYQIVTLTDPMGPAVTDSSMYGLALTEDTLANGQRINQLRKKLNLRPLETFVCPLTLDEAGQPISSRRIRAGQINRAGQVYASMCTDIVQLTEAQRQFFSQPQGEVITKPVATPTNVPQWVVGDTTIAAFLANDWPFDGGVYDLKEQRQPVSNPVLTSLEPINSVINPAGTITPELFSVLQSIKLSQKPQYLFVDGEEDLAAVALVLTLPLESVVYYGQPNQGIIAMKVTEQLKNQVFSVLASK